MSVSFAFRSIVTNCSSGQHRSRIVCDTCLPLSLLASYTRLVLSAARDNRSPGVTSPSSTSDRHTMWLVPSSFIDTTWAPVVHRCLCWWPCCSRLLQLSKLQLTKWLVLGMAQICQVLDPRILCARGRPSRGFGICRYST